MVELLGNARYVNTVTGAIADIKTASVHGGGKTHPAAVRPFGMVQLGPDTITGGDNGPGYSYHHSTIEGFSFQRMSGIGAYGDMGNLQVMPTLGEIRFHSGSNAHDLFQSTEPGWKSEFQHTSEVTTPGYYAVTLDTYGIRAQMTCTDRTGILKFSFPATGEANIQIDLARRIGGRSVKQQVRVIDRQTLEGWVHCTPEGGGFRHGKTDNTYTLYFYGHFSEPWSGHGLWNLGEDLGRLTEAENEDLGFYAVFNAETPTELLFKAGISYVSLAGARDNLEAELDHWDFERVQSDAQLAWTSRLGCVDMDGCTDAQREIFYSALYHHSLDPRIACDADGQLRRANGEVGRAAHFAYRTVFSGWDVFRSAFPLSTLIHPDLVNDEVNTFLMHARDTGQTFPRWEMLGKDTGIMVGDPGLAVSVEAFLKGIRRFDADELYEVCKRTAFGPNSTRIGMEEMNQLGHVPGRLSVTLENIYADYCIYRFAQARGDEATAEVFRQRAHGYRDLYDPDTGWLRAKDEHGAWMPWAGKYDKAGCVESNIFQQHWFVPHDVAGLIRLMGKRRFVSELEELFEKADLSALWNENYNHSNEPCHHIPHLFVYARQPWRTQYWVRRIQNEAYRCGPYGYCGNEDVGQMSAWFVLTALGMHPVCPVDGVYVLNTPLFARATLRLNPQYHSCQVSDKLVIETEVDPATNPYIRGVALNQTPLNRSWVTHQELTDGGLLRFQLGPEPNHEWGVDEPPPSLSEGSRAR